tara:strand:- start:276 stop:812 length:537 start_codon:yes stop_codon:yes gene_type:complete
VNFYRITALIALSLLGACAQAASPLNMNAGRVISTIKYNGPFKDNIIVGTVSGGEETNPLWTSEISNAGFERALELTLEDNGFLSKSGGDFELSANLAEVRQPFFGLSFTVNSAVDYVLNKSAKTQKAVCHFFINGSGTAGFSDKILGYARLKLANELSIKNNLTQMISHLLDCSKKI